MSATGSTHIGRYGPGRKASQRVPGPRPVRMEPVLKYVPTVFGYQDVFWQGERIGTVSCKGRRWGAVTASGSPEGAFGSRRAAGAHLRRLIEGRREA
jgi:hypothetical protein